MTYKALYGAADVSGIIFPEKTIPDHPEKATLKVPIPDKVHGV